MLIDNVSYGLLKQLYKRDCPYMTEADVCKVTNVGNPEEGEPNPHISLLCEERLAERCSRGGEEDGEGGFVGGVPCIRITLRGRAYVEQRSGESVK